MDYYNKGELDIENFSYAEEFNHLMREMKYILANYKELSVESVDLTATTFRPERYSDELELKRDSSNQLVYLRDNDDDTESEVILDDLKLILYNVATRKASQKKNAIDLEIFLSE